MYDSRILKSDKSHKKAIHINWDLYSWENFIVKDYYLEKEMLNNIELRGGGGKITYTPMIMISYIGEKSCMGRKTRKQWARMLAGE